MIEGLPNEILENIVYFALKDSNSLKSFTDLMLVNKRVNNICRQVMRFYEFSVTYDYNKDNKYKNLLTHFCKLELGNVNISLTDMKQLEDLFYIAPRLTSLKISDTSDLLANYNNLQFLEDFPHLKKLSISFRGIAEVEDEWMCQLALFCPKLQHLEVKKENPSPAIGEMLDIDPSLYFLRFSAAALSTLSKLSLKHIGIIQSDIESCEELQDCKFSEVETLDLSSSAILSHDIFDSLNNFPKLKKLILDQRGVDGYCIDPWWIEEEGEKPFYNFPYIPTLEVLDCLNHAFVCLDDFVNAEQLFHIKSLATDVPGTHYLDGKTLVPEDIREKFYIDFSENFKSLIDLKLNFNMEEDLGYASCGHLKHLAKIPHLKHLTISNAAFKQTELQTIAQSVNVQTLTFDDVTVSINTDENTAFQFSNSQVENIRINKVKNENSDSNIANLLSLIPLYFSKVKKIILNLDGVSWNNDVQLHKMIRKLPHLKCVVINEGQDTQKVYGQSEINDLFSYFWDQFSIEQSLSLSAIDFFDILAVLNKKSECLHSNALLKVPGAKKKLFKNPPIKDKRPTITLT